MDSRGGHGWVDSRDRYVGLRGREQNLSLQHKSVKVVLQWIGLGWS